MKKFLAVILCVVYASASSGATIHFHYCMGSVTGWDASSSSPDNCNNCGMYKQDKQGCCTDRHATFKMQKEQLASCINYVPANDFVYVKQQCISLVNQPLFIYTGIVTSSNSPPLIQAKPVYILHCVFRI